jgi:hypothetical protein
MAGEMILAIVVNKPVNDPDPHADDVSREMLLPHKRNGTALLCAPHPPTTV